MSRFDDGGSAKLFLNNHKSGNQTDTNARDAAILSSFALQYGADVEAIRTALCRDGKGQPLGPIGAALDLDAGAGHDDVGPGIRARLCPPRLAGVSNTGEPPRAVTNAKNILERVGLPRDPAAIRADFRRRPDAGIEIVTGNLSGSIVFDIDNETHDGVDGVVGLLRLEFDSVRCRTRSSAIAVRRTASVFPAPRRHYGQIDRLGARARRRRESRCRLHHGAADDRLLLG